MFSHCARWERLAGARGKWITHLTLLISIRHKTYAHRTKAYTHKRALCEQSNHSIQQESQTQNWTITTKHCYPFNVCVHQNQFRVPSVCVFRTAKRGIVLRNVCVCLGGGVWCVCVCCELGKWENTHRGSVRVQVPTRICFSLYREYPCHSKSPRLQNTNTDDE